MPAAAPSLSDDEINAMLGATSPQGMAPNTPSNVAASTGLSDDEINHFLGQTAAINAAQNWGPVNELMTGATLGAWPSIKTGSPEAFGMDIPQKTGPGGGPFVPDMAAHQRYISEVNANKQSQQGYELLNPEWSNVQKFAGSIPPSLALGSLMPEVEGPAVLGDFAPLAGKMLTSAGQGAIIGGAQTGLTGGDVGKNALIGGLTGLGFPIAGEAASALSPFGHISPEIASTMRQASDLGLNLRPGQTTTSKFGQWLDNAVASGQNSGQLRQLTKAVSHSIGLDSDTLNSAMLESRRDAIQNTMNSIAGRTSIPYSAINGKIASLQNSLDSSGISATSQAQINGAVKDIVNALDFNGKVISGDAYQRLTRSGGVVGGLASSADSNVREFGGKLRDILDDGLAAGASGKDVKALAEARRQYGNLRTLEGAVGSSEPAGVLDPSKLKNLKTNDADLSVLSNASKFLPKVTNTGAAKAAPSIPSPVKTGLIGGATVAALEHFGEPGLQAAIGHPQYTIPALALAAVTMGGKKAAGAVAGSKFLRNYAARGANPSIFDSYPNHLLPFATAYDNLMLTNSNQQR